jgi:hypothetical protein
VFFFVAAEAVEGAEKLPRSSERFGERLREVI